MYFNLDSVSIILPVIGSFVISMGHSLSQAFVTSTVNHVIFLGSNEITYTLNWLHKHCITPFKLRKVRTWM